MTSKRVKPIHTVLILVLVGLVAVYVGTEVWKGTFDRGAAAPGVEAGLGSAPEPWYYDEEHDRHWDPRPGHQHWHQGLPPEGVAPPEPPEDPEPWHYDEARDRHWDPRPGHQHWHHGPPPAEHRQE